MSCNNNDPCTSLDPCSNYDDCGCLNPTTFPCVTTTKAYSCLGVTSGEDGSSVLDKISAKICNIGKVLVDSSDTCPEYLSEKLVAGLNISMGISGSGCNRVITINSTTGGVAVDVNAKVSAADSTSDYLYEKLTTGTYLSKTILNPSGDEQIEFDLDPADLISGDVGNQIVVGGDGGLKTLYSAPDGSETILMPGTGVTLSGSGTSVDPYIINTNPAISAARSCFDNTWRAITLVASGNASVVYQSGAPSYRYRYDGSIEFKGSITYEVTFGAYTTGNRTFTIPMGNIPTTCITAGEQTGVVDMKGINYTEASGIGADQISQYSGYIVRKSAQNMSLVFQSAFLAASTVRSIVVNLDGCVQHPTI